MKRLLLLYMSIFLITFSEVYKDKKIENISENTFNVVKEKNINNEKMSILEEKIKILILENKDLKNQYGILKEKIENVESKKENRQEFKDENLGIVYNLDQIYKNANEFYKNAFDQFITEVKWLIGILLSLVGILKLKEIIDVKQLKQKMENVREELENEYKEKIDKINKDVLKSEFNREKMEIFFENREEEKLEKLEEIEKKIGHEYKFFDELTKKEFYIFKAKELEKIKKDFEAIEAYIKSLEYGKNNYNDMIAYNNLGILRDKNKIYEKAEKDYKSSLSIEEQESPYHNLVLMYLDSNKIEEAKKYIERAILRFPKSAMLYGTKGTVESREKKYYEAIKSYNEAINLDSKNKTAYFNRAMAYSKIGKNDKALDDLFYLIKTKQGCYKVFHTVGLIFFQEKNYDKAIEYFDKAIRENEFDPESYYEKLEIYKKLQKKDLVNQILGEIILKNPKEDRAYFEYADFMQDKDLKKAIEFIEKAIEIKPDESDYYNMKAHLKIKKGLKEEALESFNDAINLSKEDSRLYHDRAFLKFELGEKQEALKDYSEAIKIDNENPIFFNSRGICYENIGDEEDRDNKIKYYLKAKKDYEMLINLEENNMNKRNLSIINSKLNNFKN